MNWLCIFFPHKWSFVVNLVCEEKKVNGEKILQKIGLYQCKRCKLISKGVEVSKGGLF